MPGGRGPDRLCLAHAAAPLLLPSLPGMAGGGGRRRRLQRSAPRPGGGASFLAGLRNAAPRLLLLLSGAAPRRGCRWVSARLAAPWATQAPIGGGGCAVGALGAGEAAGINNAGRAAYSAAAGRLAGGGLELSCSPRPGRAPWACGAPLLRSARLCLLAAKCPRAAAFGGGGALLGIAGGASRA